MSEIKIEEVAKKANISIDEALEKLKSAGLKVEGGSDVINDDGIAALGIDPKKFKVDKRQELLKKVIERRKRNTKSREVYVNSESTETAPRKRISREELLKKKQELENSLKKVDEDREKSKTQEPAVEAKAPESKSEPKAPVTKPIESGVKVVEKPQAKKPAPVVEKKSSPTEKPVERKEAPKPASSKPAPSRPAAARSHESARPSTPSPKPAAPVDKTPASAFIKKTKPKTEQEIAEAKRIKAKKGPKPVKNINIALSDGIDELEMEKAVEAGKLKDEYLTPEAKAETTETPETPKKEAAAPVKRHKPQQNHYKQKGRHRKHRGPKKEQIERPVIRPEKIYVGEQITVGDFAHAMGIKAADIVMKLMGQGVMASVTQSIDFETAEIVAADYGIAAELKMVTEEDYMPDFDGMETETESRPPIVTVMGHVDHGKTSLLDRIRQTSVADGEAGGITQHIGAYEVELGHGKITFLDTPGHEAFTTLRARGANVTDIVILVVAADDGVMPQTIEAIDHAKAAGVKVVIAINKIDKENANPDALRSQLAEHNVVSEDWGGDYQFQEISAKQNINIDVLLEKVLLEAEMLEVKGNPDRPAEGIVIESRLDKQKGAVATILVANGTLSKGDFFVVGTEYGKVRAMHNHIGRTIQKAGPSCPVELMGFSGIPESGEKFIVIDSEKQAKQIAELRANKQKEKELLERNAVTLTDLFDKIKDGEVHDLNVIIKADVQGSAEALKTSLMKLSNSEVNVKVIHDGTGGINESDVLLALASKAIVIGFNVRPDANAKSVADREGIEINLYSVIYEAIDDVKNALEGMLTPEIKEEVLGKVEVRQVFSVPKIGKIAGCYVTEGRVLRSAKIRVLRDNVVIYDGDIGSLKRFTDDAKEVKSGYECGLSVEKFNDIKEGDYFEVYQLVEEKRSLADVE